MSAEYTQIPKFIVDILEQCLDAGIVPSIRSGARGNSHSVWFIKFTQTRYNAKKYCGEVQTFEVKITSSYNKFLDFTLFSGPGFDGIETVPNITRAIMLARADSE
jgi:hypothetical protein